MPVQTTYVFSTSMDVDPDKEALFNEVYENEHVPLLTKVPGVISVTRFATEPLTVRLEPPPAEGDALVGLFSTEEVRVLSASRVL